MSLLIILVMLVLNALMAAYEMAIAAASRTKLAIWAQEKRPGADSALYMWVLWVEKFYNPSLKAKQHE